MTACLFVSDLHGQPDRYRKLFLAVEEIRPAAVFVGGDLTAPFAGGVGGGGGGDLVEDVLVPGCRRLRDELGERYPRIFLILGNDDPRSEEPRFREGDAAGLWTYAHDGRFRFDAYTVHGYSFVPPTPFPLKDWERYDVSRYVDPGCVSPEEGARTIAVDADVARYATIQQDLERLAAGEDLETGVFLFHAPPYDTHLDRAALDGRTVDHAPVGVHVGSIAMRRFIESRQPLLTLHGHVHESARITGRWRDRLGRTHMLSAAHDGSELALVGFDLEDLEHAWREVR